MVDCAADVCWISYLCSEFSRMVRVSTSQLLLPRMGLCWCLPHRALGRTEGSGGASKTPPLTASLPSRTGNKLSRMPSGWQLQ